MAALANRMASSHNVSILKGDRLPYEARIGQIESDLNRRDGPGSRPEVSRRHCRKLRPTIRVAGRELLTAAGHAGAAIPIRILIFMGLVSCKTSHRSLAAFRSIDRTERGEESDPSGERCTGAKLAGSIEGPAGPNPRVKRCGAQVLAQHAVSAWDEHRSWC